MTVLISALVAALVTLVIEYFAKPSLEARKDRIVELQRSRRATRKAVNTSLFHLSRVAHRVGNPFPISSVQTARVKELHELLFASSNELRELIAAGGSELDRLEKIGVFRLGMTFESYSVIVHMSGDEGQDAAEFLFKHLDPLSDVVDELLDLPRWRKRTRRKLLAELSRYE